MALLCAGPAAAAPAPVLPLVRIGFVVDGPWEHNRDVLDLVQSEINNLLTGTHQVRFPETATVVGDWTPASVDAGIQRLLADRDVDLVIAIGVLASDRACRIAAPGKPLVAPVVLDARVQGLPSKDGTSGVHNLTYLTIPSAVGRDLRAFHELVPFDHLTILANAYIVASLPNLAQQIRQEASATAAPALVPVGSSAQAALAALPAATQAVYVLPLLQLAPAAFDSLAAGLAARKLPTFASLGETYVRRGILAGINPDMFPRMARRLAVTVQRILAGEDAGTIPTSFTLGEHLMINLATARAIGFNPTWAGLSEAELVGEETPVTTPELTLVAAMQEAVAVNRDLAAAEQRVVSGKYEVREAWAALLPQADAAGTASQIDADRARASLGTQAERTTALSATASQILFSEPALANLAIAGQSQTGREWEREGTRLDVAREAGGASLPLLRARTFERIRKENLRLTRDHLDLARNRESAGAAGLADVYRWQSEVATDRKAAIEANAQRNLAELALNRVLHRPAEQPIALHETTLDDPDVSTTLAVPLEFLGDKVSFRVYRDFMVQEGLAASPELRQFDAAIAATRRSLASTTRSFYLPVVDAQGSASRTLDRSGAGSQRTLPGPASNDTDWSLGLRARLALSRGGARLAERSRASAEAGRLEIERQASAERIEQRIRTALHRAGASYAGIHESRIAAEQAAKNLDLVADAYARGAVSLIDLLDAQNAHTVADQSAADAVYDFLDDLLETQRATGRFDFMMTPEDRTAFRQRLRDFALRNGVQTKIR